MKTFSQLEQEWNSICSNDPSLVSMLEEKLSPLLNHTEEEYVVQGMDLLLQCGSSSLVFILEEKEGSFDISEKYSGNVGAVERCVIGEVSKEDSKWFGLFDSGCFDGMYLRTMGNTDWNELSDTLQQRLLKEVGQMVEIKPCAFMMGALDDDEDASNSEKPRHEVILTRRFSIGKYQVTQALWESVMGSNPSYFKGSSRPVEKVSWMDCVLFCNKLSEKEGLEEVYTLPSGLEEALKNQTDEWDEEIDELSKDVSQNLDANGYRLPTEAEWECAARGGEYHLYAGSNNADEVGWYRDNSNGETHGVGQKKANGFGLYDMSGNVYEWCWDWFDDEEYSSRLATGGEPISDPSGPTSGSDRVFRGGSWYYYPVFMRASFRYYVSPAVRYYYGVGFRLVLPL